MPDDHAKADTGLPGAWAPVGQYAGGVWRTGQGASRDVVSPGSGDVLATLRDASSEDLDGAVAAARRAQTTWADLGPVVRGKTLKEAAARLRAHEDELAMIDALDCGNPIKGMRFDVNLGATLMEFFAGLTTELKGETIPQVGGKLTFVTRDLWGSLRGWCRSTIRSCSPPPRSRHRSRPAMLSF